MRLKYLNNWTLYGILTMLLISCEQQDQSTINQSAWSSKEPLSIPIQQRRNIYNLGNLVENPSFENGRVFYEGSEVRSFDLDAWKRVGKEIEWVDVCNEKYSENEAYNGTKSVLIDRKKADETEKVGVGVVSDYIKVIPGNYRLSIYAKMQNVCSNRLRLGAKLMDAVNIRLQFYDKNKIVISNETYNPDTEIWIDNSFKALSLANFWSIDNMDWGEIIGHSASFPFWEGDLPDNTRYVKIFIGLKGTGKLWIDNVDFRYTKDNFSAKEKCLPYFDSIISPVRMLQPTPQYAEFIDSVKILKEGVDYPLILLPEKYSKIENNFARQIQEYLESTLSGVDEIFPEIRNKYEAEKDSGRFIIAINNSALGNLNDSISQDILERKESYIIYSDTDQPNLVSIRSTSVSGFNAAFNTFSQLITCTNKFIKVRIFDYPKMPERALRFTNILNDTLSIDHSFFAKNNINSVFFNELSFINLVEKSKGSGIDYGLAIDISGKNKISLSKDLNLALTKGISNFIFCTDIRDKKVDCYSDTIDRNTSLSGFYSQQISYAKLIKDAYKHVKRKDKEANIAVVSPWGYGDEIDISRGYADLYFNEFYNILPDDVVSLCYGESYCTKSMDAAAFKRLKYILHNNLTFVSNSLQNQDIILNESKLSEFYSGKIRSFEVFNPFVADIPGEIVNDKDFKLFVTVSGNQLNKLQIATIADYLWNPDAYNPEFSYWKNMVNLYGKETALELIEFSENYYALIENNIRLNKNIDKNKFIKLGTTLKRNVEVLHVRLIKSKLEIQMKKHIETLIKEVLTEYDDIQRKINENQSESN